MKKILSVILTACMIVPFAACNKSSQPVTAANENSANESTVINGDSAENLEAETVAATETSNSAMTDGQYTYVVDGIEVHLRTNIDDYIQPDQWGGYGVDLEGIANAWGFEYIYSSNDSAAERCSWSLNSDMCYSEISLDDLRSQNFYSLYFVINNGWESINFSRNDIDDSSETTYWVSYEENAINKVNFEQIVIFALLVENASTEPSVDWMSNYGFTEITEGYSINK